MNNYDDDELVQLLGRGELSHQQIAERLGMSAAQVGRIARGENRPDLHPKIYAAMRQTLKAAWKNGGRLDGLGTGRLDTESGQPLPAAAHTPFDRHLAVELIASGQLTLSQIAKRLGIHKSSAWRIITGRTHPELQPLIREAQGHYRERARRLGSYWSAQLMMKQIEVGLKNNGWVGLRARQHLLDRVLGEEEDDKSDAPPRPLLPIRSMTELSPPLFAAVLKELGGADLGPEDYENYAAEHKDRAAVLEELDGPGPDLSAFAEPPKTEDADRGPVLWNDPSTWRPVGAAAACHGDSSRRSAKPKPEGASRSRKKEKIAKGSGEQGGSGSRDPPGS